MKSLRSRTLAGTVVSGVLVSLVTGLIENPPEASIIGARHYGYPFVWRITMTTMTGSAEIRFASLAIDAAFWVAISQLALITMEKLPTLRFDLSQCSSVFLPLIMFVPFGLVMAFVHELGHAVWGIAFGGKLTYMKVAYLEIYPRLALTPVFVLGLVRVQGLTTEFASGLFLLGGSMTTNAVSWLLALNLLRAKPGSRTRIALMILGLFGLLDLPFYVLFPQMGLRHWIFIGGVTPEPLIGARKMGIPDHMFYAVTVLTTLGLMFLYFKSFWQSCWKEISHKV